MIDKSIKVKRGGEDKRLHFIRKWSYFYIAGNKSRAKAGQKLNFTQIIEWKLKTNIKSIKLLESIFNGN